MVLSSLCTSVYTLRWPTTSNNLRHGKFKYKIKVKYVKHITSCMTITKMNIRHRNKTRRKVFGYKILKQNKVLVFKSLMIHFYNIFHILNYPNTIAVKSLCNQTQNLLTSTQTVFSRTNFSRTNCIGIYVLMLVNK